ncbi:hypothetical protein ROLI_003770 [Roseobacter fucihabitans]|uniref:Uncharacterized protein n=1 Tax=Roseobacter fucihabitans TaxID=1537242 RepID=A0ABZ2BPD6_9RHOB|nr:hypothetical protein [Roseobacter litoralis]MBC6963627.1 hypothetical protein [Roseobacter litoralis]
MKTVLDSMRERMSWNVARVILRWAGVEPAHGWDKTQAKYADTQNPDAEAKLLDYLADHNVCGEKFTKIYQITSETRDALQTAILSLSPGDNDFALCYPLSRDPEKITQLGDPELVAIQKTDDGLGAVFANAVRLTKRETIEFDDLSDDSTALQQQYDEIVGLKFRTVQLFSVIWVPHDHASVEIRTDLPTGMSMDLAHALQSTLRQKANSLGVVTLDGPVDLYPLLEAIYQADGEGDVVELGFLTTTASVKNEKMRRSKLDLREEPYHLHGKEGLGTPIEPFKMFVRWNVEIDGVWLAPEIGLVGTARGRSSLGQPNAVGISGAIVKNCYGRPDFEHVIGKIHEYLDKCQNSDASRTDPNQELADVLE